MFRFVKRVFLGTLIVAVVLVGIQPENLQALSQTIRFHVKLWDLWQLYSTPPLPVALLFGVFFLLGLLSAGVHGVYERMSRRAEIRRRDRRIRELEAEVEALRVRLAEREPPSQPPGPEAPAERAPPAKALEAPSHEEEPTL